MLPRLVAALAAVATASVTGGAAAQAQFSFSDRPLTLPSAFAPPDFTGGVYTTSTGELVRVFSAPAYATDPSFNQRWADFVASMPHGSEISTVTIYLAPLAQLGTVCGLHTIGCYSHEYGHHIANSRRNTPWSAEDYGTKRWATHEDVCRKAHDETLYPGDEGEHYKLNSGEVFAESYRVLVEQKLGLPSSPWLSVAPSLQPDATALELLAEDISSPWTGPAVSTRTGSFRPYTGDARTIGFTAPLDGVATLRLRAPAGSAYDVRLFDPSGRRLLAETKPGARRAKTIRYLVCGEHSFELRVVRTRGFGPFTLQISKP